MHKLGKLGHNFTDQRLYPDHEASRALGATLHCSFLGLDHRISPRNDESRPLAIEVGEQGREDWGNVVEIVHTSRAGDFIEGILDITEEESLCLEAWRMAWTASGPPAPS